MAIKTAAEFSAAVAALLTDQAAGETSEADLRSLFADVKDNAVWLKDIGTVVTLGTTGTINPDFGTSWSFTMTPTGAVTLGTPTNQRAGQTIRIAVPANTHLVSFSTEYASYGGIALPMDGVKAAYLVLDVVADSGVDSIHYTVTQEG